jgi:hypothetical protein
MMFSNIPNELVFFLWTNSMKQMEELREGIGKVEGARSVIMNVLQIGYIFDTWRDKMVLEKAAAVP